MLDGQPSDEQYMKELYERFLKGVVDNDNSEFYEKDELLDIYDSVSYTHLRAHET